MNPNSQNQRWSYWTFEVRHHGTGTAMPVTRTQIQSNLSRFVKTLFGSSAGQMDIRIARGKLAVKLLIEGLNITPYDPTYFEFIKTQMTAFFVSGFGSSVTVAVEGKLMAGSRQDGTPPDQMIILPTIENLVEV